MTTPTPLQAMLDRFDKRFMEPRMRPTGIVVEEVKDIKSFLTSEFTALLGEIEREVEKAKAMFGTEPNAGTTALETTLAIIRKYSK